MHLLKSAALLAAITPIALVSLAPAPAVAGGLGIASDYNVFVFGDMNQSSDAEGRVAVGGNATFTNFGIGDRLPNSNGSDTRLVVGGDLNYNGGQIFGGNAIVGGSVNTPVYFNCAPNCGVSQGSPIDFVAAQQNLLDASAYWGSLATTGTAEHKWGGIWLEGDNSSQSVFNIDGSWFSNSTYLNINKVANNATVLFNVFGDTVNIANFGLNLNGINKENVLFNFVDATQLSTTGFSFTGSVLAPKAHYTFNNGNLEGNLVAASVSGSGEFHNFQFKGNLPTPPVRVSEPPDQPPASVPEPALGLGLLAVGALMIRRRDGRPVLGNRAQASTTPQV
ncbi:choice-of-anchor A family protein [Leptolyngbya sp. PCC 6406]|uniref:choice-of-anchor A family protein n=1 Tax=Leptolyngbya sp. PCC 6406 TaxID=1173264 RepID=UPI0002ABC740|nr:choice-of-anchor A family protein [Leptolyngbya sp. PCC 6406]